MLLLEPYHLVALLLLLVPAGRCLAATAGGGGDDSRQFILLAAAMTGANLTLDGASRVMPNGLLLLTDGRKLKGHGVHPFPLPFRTASNATGSVRPFSTTFVFAISSQYDDVSSDGIAFFVAASREVLSTASPGQFLGLLNEDNIGNRSARIFAVELDTFKDDELRDINNNHVGVDVDSLVSIDSTNAGYYDDGTGMFQNLSLISQKPMQVWVDYDSRATEITVTMAPLGVVRPKKPLLRTTVDLSGVVQNTAYVGFSSATNFFPTRHVVLGWSFALDEPAPALNISMLPALPSTSTSTYMTRWSIWPMMIALASVTLVSVSILIYICVRRQRLKYSEVREDWEAPFGSNRFSYKDLFHATKGFSDKNLLGRGGFGSVYRGVLRKTGMKVAVKRMSHDSRQGVREFIAKVVSIGRLRH
uniref:non-specific serine/threonine protein kinase n=1 Tax=Aegilops tauschii subsp. strangulata TaxID=200361 RepID=A0A453AKF2_AEGTS